MKQAWFEENFSIIEQVMLLRIPFEIIHFPDTGIHSTLTKYAELGKIDESFPTKTFFIDMRSATFSGDRNMNREEFYRVLRSQMELYHAGSLSIAPDQNIFRLIENITNGYLAQKRKVLFAFQLSAQIDLKLVPDFKDFIIFLDHIRDYTKGSVNLILSTTTPLFNDKNPSPIPLITKYFAYFDQGRIYRSLKDDILNDSPYKKNKPEDILKLIDISGGLISVVKNLIRDFIILKQKLATIHSTSIDKAFFESYPHCKARFDRIMEQLPANYKEALFVIATGGDIAVIDKNYIDYFRKTTILDENNKIRGSLIIEYLKNYYKKPQVLDKVEVGGLTEGSAPDNLPLETHIIRMSNQITVNKISGEIFKNNILQKDYLTEKELKILNLLVDSNGRGVTRDEIAKVMWGSETQVSYSDWAIDKTVSRLRDKLGDYKPYKLIRTVRGMGFIITLLHN